MLSVSGVAEEGIDDDLSAFHVVLGQADRSYYIGSAEGHEYPDLQVGDEVNPRPFFVCS